MQLSLYIPNILRTATDKVAAKAATGPMGWLKSWTVERRRQRMQREAFHTLLRVDADILEDVTGLRRDQVERAAQLPLHVDATKAVQMMRDPAPAERRSATDDLTMTRSGRTNRHRAEGVFK